jgi:outer membrane protein OmpA-like peptidoglycan-associated protein
LDFVQLPFGSLLFSAGYRFDCDVPLKYQYQRYQRDAVADLKHTGQFQLGILARFCTSSNFEYGAGLDARFDGMKASGRVGKPTEEKTWRPWLRASARYTFGSGAYLVPFIGIEAAYALSGPSIDPADHYRDYAINTGDHFLGEALPPSKESFTKGHFPAWEAVLVGGFRFGGRRRSAPASSAQDIGLAAIPETDPEPAEEEISDDADVELIEEEAPIALDSLPPEERIKVEGFKSLLIHFEENSVDLTNETKISIDKWVSEVWNGAGYSKLFDTSRLRIVANCDDQTETGYQRLSERRGHALADYLWDKFRINIAKIFGYGITKPIAESGAAGASAKNRYAQLVLDENDFRNADYKNIMPDGSATSVK